MVGLLLLYSFNVYLLNILTLYSCVPSLEISMRYWCGNLNKFHVLTNDNVVSSSCVVGNWLILGRSRVRCLKNHCVVWQFTRVVADQMSYWKGVYRLDGIRTFSQRTFSQYLQGGHLANIQIFYLTSTCILLYFEFVFALSILCSVYGCCKYRPIFR